jgi:hypothetical protein
VRDRVETWRAGEEERRVGVLCERTEKRGKGKGSLLGWRR